MILQYICNGYIVWESYHTLTVLLDWRDYCYVGLLYLVPPWAEMPGSCIDHYQVSYSYEAFLIFPWYLYLVGIAACCTTRSDAGPL